MFYLPLKREEGECEMEQKMSVFCKYPEHISQQHIRRKSRKKEIYESCLEVDR